jgi:hypothetical protein
MTPKDVATLLSVAFRHRMPVLLTGAPGIGKTDTVVTAAKNAGSRLIVSNPVVDESINYKGLPRITATGAEFVAFGQLKLALEATEPTVYFIDDIGQASASVQAACMALLLAREIDGKKIPDCVTFCAATNRRSDKAGVSGILEPVKSRFATIIEMKADVEDWAAWATTAGIDPRLIGFLRFRPDLLSAFKPTAEMTNSPSPRTWSRAAAWLATDLPPGIRDAAIAGAVGPAAGLEFNAFLRAVETMPDPRKVFAQPDIAPIPKAPDVLFALCAALVAIGAKKGPSAASASICVYTRRLAEAGHGEFAAVLFKDAVNVIAGFSEENPTIALMSSKGTIGALIL